MQQSQKLLLCSGLVALALLLICGNAAGQFVTNGSASNAGNGCYHLTEDTPGQAGSIFSTAPINLNQPFFYSARLSFGCKDGNGADGIVFIFTTTNTALGAGGGGLGYQGVAPSVAIEWDDYQNGGFGDPASDHVAIMQNGSVDHNSPNNLAGPLTLPNIEDCNDHCLTVSWIPAIQTLTGELDGTSISFTGDIINTIFGGNSSVFWGFSSGTGSLSNLHQVCDGPPVLEPMVDVAVCPGQSVQLQADPNGSGYFWAPHPTLSSFTISNPVATPINSTIYSVTITYPCGGTAADDIFVTVLPVPPAVAWSNSPVCMDETLELMANGGVSYSWEGPQGFSSSSQNPALPNVTFDQAGLYSVTVTGANNCTATATTLVVVYPPPAIAIIPPPQPFCVSDPVYTLEGIPAGGTWGGAANAAGEVNPATLGIGVHLVTYTATDGNGCTGIADLLVEVVGPPSVSITPAGPYCESDPPDTLSAAPTGGVWSGAADTSGVVHPAALGPGQHTVIYTAPNGAGCEASDTITIEVGALPSVMIAAAGPYCESDPPDTLSAAPTGGVWSGVADASGAVDPAALGPGQHVAIYTVMTAQGCVANDSLTFLVNALPQATISGGGSICAGSGQTVEVFIVLSGMAPFTVQLLQDGAPQAPLTVNQDTLTLQIGSPGVYSIAWVSDANGCQQTGNGTAVVTVNDSPAVSSVALTCDSTSTVFTLAFTISGGDSASYSVSGVPGTLTPGNPASFLSDPLVAGTTYHAEVFDANGCDTIVLTNTHTCMCLSNAGDMETALLEGCPGDTLEAVHLGNHFADGNDNLVFVLHSNNGNSLGTVYALNDEPAFWLVPPMQVGVTYFVSAVVGNDDGQGGVDFDDLCLDVSIGQPVRFNQSPGGSLDSDVEICEANSTSLVFTLTGNGPFDISYFDGQQVVSLSNVFNGHTIAVQPAVTTAFVLMSVADNNNPSCTGNPSDTAWVTVHPVAFETTSERICPGDSLFLAGAWQVAEGTYSDTLSTAKGCDSVIQTSLFWWPSETTPLFETSCSPADTGVFLQLLGNQYGCDSTVITTVSLLPSDTTFLTGSTCDPGGAGSFSALFQNQWGCDSTVITEVSLLPSDTTFLSDTTCDPGGTGTFTQVWQNQWGCDSTVVIEVLFLEADTTWLYDAACDASATGIFIENLLAADGCDSTVITTVALLPSDTVFLNGSTCDAAQSGTFTELFQNQWGCDSTVITTVALLPSDTVFLNGSTCDAAQSGTFAELLQNQWGCDSTVVTTVALLPSDTVFLNDSTCDAAQSGTFTGLFQNQWGCDSTVVTTVALLPSDTVFLNDSTCDAAQSGTFTALFQNQWGCDSTVITTVSLLPADTTVLQVFTCQPSDTGTVQTHYSNQYGCDSLVVSQRLLHPLPKVSVEVEEPFNGYELACYGDADAVGQATASGGTPPYNFVWSTGQQGSTATGLSEGAVEVTLTDGNGCADTVGHTLLAPPPLEFTFIINSPECFDQLSGYLEALPGGGVAPYLFSLNGGVYGAQSAFANLPAGTYQVDVLDANGCLTSEIVWLNAPLPVDIDLGEDQEIRIGDAVTVNAVLNIPYDSLATVHWSGLDSMECPACLQQIVAPLITTTYSIEVTDTKGCTDSDQVNVIVDRRKHVYVPNAFSPNQDGINDWFYVFAKPGTVARIKSFLVFSRWGEAVYEYYNFDPNIPTLGWNGSHRGQVMDPGVFVWFAEVAFTDGSTVLFEGDVVLMR